MLTLIATVIVVGILSFAAYRAYITPNGNNSTSSTDHFITQPVGDVIISKLAVNANNGGTGIPLNITDGETVNLTVSIYIEVTANVSAEFRVLTGPSPSPASAIAASFDPSSLLALANQNASTVMTVRLSSSAPLGVYTAVVSVQDNSNPSYVWGTNIQIDVPSG